MSKHTNTETREDNVSLAWMSGPRSATLGGRHRAEGYPPPTMQQRTFVSIPKMTLSK